MTKEYTTRKHVIVHQYKIQQMEQTIQTIQTEQTEQTTQTGHSQIRHTTILLTHRYNFYIYYTYIENGRQSKKMFYRRSP